MCTRIQGSGYMMVQGCVFAVYLMYLSPGGKGLCDPEINAEIEPRSLPIDADSGLRTR